MNKVFLLLFFLPLFLCGQSKGSLTKAELTTYYSQAISDYIMAVNKEHNIRFDTLFFGKHDQFPDITLPESIANTKIKLIRFEDAVTLQAERQSSYYINMVGWGNKNNYEFMFVTFTNGSAHQFDYFINYKYNAKRKSFESINSRFEYYLFKKQ